ncbi:MAG: hypothetical protein KGI71_03255, partial [Patescibacteria group bacterium]|nr:hypothetical protein [Patescibacteria group bacterium]
MNSPGTITALFLLLLLCVSGSLYYPRYVSRKASAAQLGTLLAVNSHIDPLSPRTKSSNCVVYNASPDSACTPGAVFQNATLDHICVSGYTATVRNVPEKLRRSV